MFDPSDAEVWKEPNGPALLAAIARFHEMFPTEKFGRKAMLERQEFNRQLGFKKKKRRG